MKVVANYKAGYHFEVSIREHVLHLDAPAKEPAKESGPTPKEALLAAIAGCTGMDVVALLGKYKQNFESLSVSVAGAPRDQHPKKIPQFDVVYEIKGNDLEQQKVINSVEQSMSRYCAVSAMVADSAPIFITVVINNDIVHRGQAKFAEPK